MPRQKRRVRDKEEMASTHDDDDVDCMVQRALARTLVRAAPMRATPFAPVDAHPSRTTLRLGNDGSLVDVSHDGRPLDVTTATDMVARARSSLSSDWQDPMRVCRTYPVPASSMGSWGPPRSLLDDDGRGPTDDVAAARRHNFDLWIEERRDILENVERMKALGDCLNEYDRALFACVSTHGAHVLFDDDASSITRGLRFRRIRKTYNDDHDDRGDHGPMLNALLWQAVSDDDDDDDDTDVVDDHHEEETWWRRPPTFETVPSTVLDALIRPFWEIVDEHLWRPFGRQSVMLFGQHWTLSASEEDDEDDDTANQWTISPGELLLGDDPWSGMMRDACNCIVQAVRFREEEGEEDAPFVYECLRMEPVHRPPEAAEDAATYVVPLVPLDVEAFWSVAREQLQETLSSRPIHSLSLGLHRRIAFREPDHTVGSDARWAWSVTITWCWKP